MQFQESRKTMSFFNVRQVAGPMRLGACLVVSTLLVGCIVGESELSDQPSVLPPGEPPATIEPNATCSSGCHGSGNSSAPPADISGQTDRSLQSVGAHRVHLESTLYRAVACTDCHQVPAAVGDPGHMDGDNRAEITFSGLNPEGVYDPATGTCSNMYCHSDAFSILGAAQWTTQSPQACGSCHSVSRDGQRMSGDHRKHLGEGLTCSDCHSQVVDQAMAFIDPTLHVNGIHEINMPTGGTFNAADRRCSNLACHGSERW